MKTAKIQRWRNNPLPGGPVVRTSPLHKRSPEGIVAVFNLPQEVTAPYKREIQRGFEHS